MNMQDLSSFLRNMNPGERKVIYRGLNKTAVTAARTDKICPHDFKVGLEIPDRAEFYPTHIRLLFDLYLKRLSNPSGSHDLFLTMERVYDGEDPETLASQVLNIEFPMKLDGTEVNLYCTQLMMIEQEFNYGPLGCKIGKVNPPREFLMRFIRWVASGDEEIDKIIFNAVRNYPPPSRYSRRIK